MEILVVRAAFVSFLFAALQPSSFVKYRYGSGKCPTSGAYESEKQESCAGERL